MSRARSPTVDYEQVAATQAARRWSAFSKPIRQDGNASTGSRAKAICCAFTRLIARSTNICTRPNPGPLDLARLAGEYRDPGSPAVSHVRRKKCARRSCFTDGCNGWWMDRLLRVQKHALAAGMSIGLYHDLALATDRCGSDLWAWRPFFITGCRVGSPPDGFSPNGQDWSFPPPNTVRHRADGYRLFAESIRKSMRHGGALRIDHVMRLFRLYWIPEGHSAQGWRLCDGPGPRSGARPGARKRSQPCVIVGEDLGTVENEVRETLARFGILSYKLLYFERTYSDGMPEFRQPGEYPASALTSTSTRTIWPRLRATGSAKISRPVSARVRSMKFVCAQQHRVARWINSVCSMRCLRPV